MTTPETAPMVTRRTPEVMKVIGAKFARASDWAVNNNYHAFGQDTDYAFGFDRRQVFATDLAGDAIAVAAAEDRPVSIVDIGAGMAGFLREVRDTLPKPTGQQLTALSALNYFRSFDETLTRGIGYVIANTELPESVAQIAGADLVVSSKCFQHLADPVGTLEMVSSSLRRGARLAIDGFMTRNLDPDNLVEACHRQGYQPELARTYQYGIEALVLRKKTDAPLALPYDFETRTSGQFSFVAYKE